MKALTYIDQVKFALLDKPKPVLLDPMNHHYLVLGKKVGQAFHDGLALK